jgi:hypothetical protein
MSAQVGVQAVGSVANEYNSQSVNAASLQTKLIELGTAGWEVFSVVSTNGSVDTGGDGKPHVITQRFEVTSKRVKRR